MLATGGKFEFSGHRDFAVGLAEVLARFRSLKKGGQDQTRGFFSCRSTEQATQCDKTGPGTARRRERKVYQAKKMKFLEPWIFRFRVSEDPTPLFPRREPKYFAKKKQNI